MKKQWALTQEAFDGLLGWLDREPEAAGIKYEQIRRRLIKLFTCRGCVEADDLADETINRVTAKVAEIVAKYSGDPALYFYGVAQKVHLEYLRRKQPIQVADLGRAGHATTLRIDDDLQQEYECLERCMEQLPDANRRLVLEYYQEEKAAKIDHRKGLATELGIGLNALRIRAHRIRLQLQECVKSCLQYAPAH
jgi:DNA-directed RNA polymerase specialized sigma24 family protein